MRKTIITLAFLFVFTISLWANPFPYNGNFSYYQGWGRPAKWNPATESGKHKFTMDPIPRAPTQEGGLLSMTEAVIETQQSGRGYYFQHMDMLEGDYQLSVDVRGKEGSRSIINVGNASSGVLTLAEQWQKITLDFKAVSNSTGIYLYTDSPSDGEVRFRRAKIKVLRLESSPVPFSDNSVLGGIVMPSEPLPTEIHACYELQKYIYKMTGKVPGVKGRDKVFKGKMIYLGRAASSASSSKLKKLANDSYSIEVSRNRIDISGNEPQGILYAVYDFLKQQGCLWVMPGEIGEVVPQRKSLLAVKDKLESPDYDLVRACKGGYQIFNPGGGIEAGWNYTDIDATIDWALRNRLNAIWTGGPTVDFGEHRGHGWIQGSGHSFNASIAPYSRYFEDHPEWYPLVRGKRMAVADMGPRLPNQLCVSNQQLRDYTVDLVLEFFKNNPTSKAFPMNPMDGPNYNCECSECKALDPDPNFKWNQVWGVSGKNWKVPDMADRYLNYISYVAERVSKVYPDKYLELYTYANRVPPVREKVHPNVMIKYCWHSGRGNAVSIMDPENKLAIKEREWLDGWLNAGTRCLTYYNYTDWETRDAALFWFFNISDLLKNLKEHYGCRGLMGEVHTHPMAAPMWWAVTTQTLWDTDTDYNQVIIDTCKKFYGSASDEMTAYHQLMDKTILSSNVDQESYYHPNKRYELTLSSLQQGYDLLDKAAVKVKEQPVLNRRIVYARLAHSILTYMRASNEQQKTKAWAKIARKSFDLANKLRSEYNIKVTITGARSLKTFYYPEILADEFDTVLDLPVTWKFKTDPENKGKDQRWFEKSDYDSWADIKTTDSWTSQGYDYHGQAWYTVEFSLPKDAYNDKLVINFGAIDGYADVYLDGIEIGKLDVEPDNQWDKPFSVVIPEIKPKKTHRLVVAVRKYRFSAGIWKPVKILKVVH